jgi:hypothetical protein
MSYLWPKKDTLPNNLKCLLGTSCLVMDKKVHVLYSKGSIVCESVLDAQTSIRCLITMTSSWDNLSSKIVRNLITFNQNHCAEAL